MGFRHQTPTVCGEGLGVSRKYLSVVSGALSLLQWLHVQGPETLHLLLHHSNLPVYGLAFRVQGLGFRVWGLGVGV